jgi:hypothetical protein
MARYQRGKKALYEVMSKTRQKSTSAKKTEPLRPPEPKQQEKAAPKPDSPPSPSPANIRMKPKAVQFNAGRVEVSIPYPLAIAVGLGLVLVVLVAYRLGQISQRLANSTARVSRIERQDTGPGGRDSRSPQAGMDESMRSATAERETTDSSGNNRIVIQAFHSRKDLVPVQKHFAQSDIETEIKQLGGWYYLVTKEKYDNPEKQGTDGYAAKQRIIQIGANYKAPPGYETFGTEPFHDAYGMKFDD